MKSIDDLLEFDREHIWHPYSTTINPPPVYPVATANGSELQLEDGRTLIDGMASWWSVIHGYNHPTINQALHRQIDELAHVMFGGLTHRPAISLAEKLVSLLPAPLQVVFFADSGSVSVEVAIKMALQYHASRGANERRQLLTVRGGYHGDTFGAMAVCDPVTGMHGLFQNALSKHIFVDRPQVRFGENWDEASMRGVKEAFRQHARSVAAVIIEPVVQGAGGMYFYHPEYLRQVRALCDEHEVLLIFDEIATGFGRTGKLFAMEHAGISPDIVCLGKAMTGGYMTLAATVATQRIAEVIGQGNPGVFMHGPTFMANPLACTAANASIDLLLASSWQNNVATIASRLHEGLAPCIELPEVKDVRVLGGIGVVELKRPVDMRKIMPAIVESGVWIRPFGHLIYVMPPYIITAEQLSTVTRAIFNLAADSDLQRR